MGYGKKAEGFWPTFFFAEAPNHLERIYRRKSSRSKGNDFEVSTWKLTRLFILSEE